MYLTTYMLGKILADKIATLNPIFKDMIKNSHLDVSELPMFLCWLSSFKMKKKII